jgi:hypothetical protein
MRPLRPFCGTVLKAQLLTLPATIKTSANGVVTTQLSFLPPASSSATDVFGSSDSLPATAQPPEPPPTTTKSDVSLTPVSPGLLLPALGPRAFPRRSISDPFVAPKLRFYAHDGKTGSARSICAVLDVTKTSKTAPWAFPKQRCVDTYRSHPGALPGLPSQEASGRDRSAPKALAAFASGPVFRKAKQRFNAGWSSPVARQAHNLKVIGSNPIPATKTALPGQRPGRVFCCAQRMRSL